MKEIENAEEFPIVATVKEVKGGKTFWHLRMKALPQPRQLLTLWVEDEKDYVMFEVLQLKHSIGANNNCGYHHIEIYVERIPA